MSTQVTTLTSDNRTLPGDLAMWFFILAELTVFAIMFISFGVTEHLNQEMFANGKEQLHTISGVLNTVVLITSSLFVALSLLYVKDNRNKQAVIALAIAQCFAIAYLLIKGGEYVALFNVGIDIETNTFFTLYFLITGFHFLHVLLGMAILAYLMLATYRGTYKTDAGGFEAGASYWHMVDLLWIILFPLIYVI